MTFLWLSLGLVLLLAGGEALVRGSVAVAWRLGLSPLLIGLTLVGFGTSTPELVASLNAALVGSPGIAIGNVVGSNIANVLLILGIGALLLPIALNRAAFRRDAGVLIACSLLCLAAVLWGTVGRAVGLAFLALLAVYTVYSFVTERRRHDAAAVIHEAEAEDAAIPRLPLLPGLLLAVGGIAAVVFGADLLVGAAIVLARDWGVSESVIGVSLVAVGTSLPELAATVTAALRRHPEVAFGNIVGSNIFNVLGILGVTATVTPIAVPPEIIRLDVWVMVAAVTLMALFGATGLRLNRWEGGALLTTYGAYVAVQFHPGLRALLGLA